MSSIGNAIGSIVGGITGTSQQADAAQQAASTQAAGAQSAINQQNSMYDSIMQLMSPYITSGSSALSQQNALLGLSGNDAQTSAINNVKTGSAYQTALKQGENSILQNASATGGLRGGNTQAALEQYSPTLLNLIVQQQYSNLSGLSSQGLNAANSQAGYGANTANSISSLLTQQAAATAGGQIAQGNQVANTFGTALSGIGALKGVGGLSGLAALF
jgi:hypothetical protein